MILGRLGIRAKLNVLLLLALAAILLVATPFVAAQVDNARSAGRTADIARHARELGALIWQLQRERLLTAAFLAMPTVDSTDLVLQQHVVDDTAERVRASLGAEASDELAASLVRLGSLQEPRQAALRRGISGDSVARTYHAVIAAVIDALRLVPQKTSDAEGTRQLTALDALLRANEQNALRGMALIATAMDRQSGQVVLDEASAQAPMLTERFVQQADVEHAALVVLVDQGEAARRVDALARALPQARTASATEAFVSDVLGAVESQSNLRRFVQDQVTGQIADAAAARADSARLAAWLVGLGAAALFGLVAVLSVAVSRSIANPLRRLTGAATRVADLAETELVRVSDTEAVEEQVPRLASIEVSSHDEVGKLAAAFNRVQSTAARLVERQAVTRRNVGLMFANVAQRTQNLVGRQLTLVDDLERNEQDVQVLASLYRLDHLSTRLRRTADNLLVVAGAREETRINRPIELATALRSALAEIEDYQRVRLGDVCDVMLASSLGPDLVLVFAELLENATSFSPPETYVEVTTALLTDGSCQVSVIDHGIGMTHERLAEENGRLVERERLDITPTSVLGLFVVGRLARRHSLTVTLSSTPGGGVTAQVVIPEGLFSHIVVPETAVPRAEQLGISGPPRPLATAAAAARPLPLPPPPELHIPPATTVEGFDWFPTEAPALEASPAAATPVAADQSPAQPLPPSPGGLTRRVPGAQMPDATLPPDGSAAKRRPEHDAAATRAALDGFQSAVTTAAASTGTDGTTPTWRPPPAPSAAPAWPAELTRRVPGANLAPGLRKRPAGSGPAHAAGALTVRDPEAERSAFDAFTTGLARAVAPGAAGPELDLDPTKESTQ